jgi:hypothetical protein
MGRPPVARRVAASGDELREQRRHRAARVVLWLQPDPDDPAPCTAQDPAPQAPRCFHGGRRPCQKCLSGKSAHVRNAYAGNRLRCFVVGCFLVLLFDRGRRLVPYLARTQWPALAHTRLHKLPNARARASTGAHALARTTAAPESVQWPLAMTAPNSTVASSCALPPSGNGVSKHALLGSGNAKDGRRRNMVSGIHWETA